ncbi:MAG: LURP-one-related family protein [Oscillospiraceae bacterium]|nr:LURP-one-related family protein [Oscillospiraceae bacterium]
MQLYIKQRIFSWTDSYDVYDETGEARYEVKAELFAFGHQIHVFDKRTGREVGSIHQKLFTFLPEFEIVINGQPQGSIRKEFSLFTPRYQVDYRNWDVEGDFLGWDYRVTQGNTEIMSISKELFNWSDTYVLRYSNPANEMPGLLLVIAIDAVNCSHND